VAIAISSLVSLPLFVIPEGNLRLLESPKLQMEEDSSGKERIISTEAAHRFIVHCSSGRNPSMAMAVTTPHVDRRKNLIVAAVVAGGLVVLIIAAAAAKRLKNCGNKKKSARPDKMTI
jgi:hypothetical protein